MNEDHKRIRRQAFAGMLWTRQVYLYDVAEWLREGPEERCGDSKRNRDWIHASFADVLSVCDGWEYPWHASLVMYSSLPFPQKELVAGSLRLLTFESTFPFVYRWDLAFHIVLYAHLDPSFAKEQALVLFRSGKVHPKGSPPAYEWDFGDYVGLHLPLLTILFASPMLARVNCPEKA